MKKVLLTTSALTLLAGAAVADVSLSGYGRMGVTYSGVTGATTTYSRFRLNIVGSTQSDGGLTFGAWSRIQTTQTTTGTSARVSGHKVWVSNGTMTLTLGNTGGAVAQSANIWGCGVGFTGACNDMADNSFTTHDSNSSTGGGAELVRLDFSLGSANISVSGGNSNRNEIAANFSLGSASVGIGYSDDSGFTPTTFLNVSMDAGSAKIGLRTANNSLGTGYIAWVNYGMGSGSLYAYAGNNNAGSSEYGVSYAMPLGGGVTAKVALWSTGGTAMASAGAQFNF